MSVFHIRTARDLHVCGRKCTRFPLVLSAGGEALLDVMRYLLHCYAQGAAESGLVTYANHLKDLHEQLHVDGLPLQSVSLALLNGYREAIEERASKPYAGQVLRTVLSYLMFLEERGVISGVIGESPRSEVVVSRSRSGGISHRLTRGAASPKSNHVPAGSAIETVKRFGPIGRAQRERFELMVDWGHVKGLRAKEICGLTCSQIPSSRAIEAALAGDRTLQLRLVLTKGSKERNIDVHPLLLARTRKWIDVDRPGVERIAKRRAAKSGRVYQPSDAVFLSSTTGAAITPKAFSNMVRAAFKAAVDAGLLMEDQRVWAHGLRKVMINRDIRARAQSDHQLPERAVMEEVGHGSLASLGRYVVADA